MAPPVTRRLAAAKLVADAGYEVRLRIEPMVAFGRWQRAYAKLVGHVFSCDLCIPLGERVIVAV